MSRRPIIVNSGIITEQNARQMMAQRETERAREAHMESLRRNEEGLKEMRKITSQQQQRKTDQSRDSECFDLVQNVYQLCDSHHNPNIAYFNTLSSFIKNVNQELIGTESESLIEDITVKSKIIFQCLAKQIDQTMSDIIKSHGGGKSRNQKGRKNKRTKRNKS